ncbi:hypothetical protein B0H11DRAFT_1921381 [Mycena galericulata]|nr:hypothetical protein B0H11DRAFT_1921381 [Mycena galericulata]
MDEWEEGRTMCIRRKGFGRRGGLRLNSIAMGRKFTVKDTVPFVQYGVRTYALTTAAGWSLIEGGTAVAQVLHAAAHGIDLAGRASQFIPAHLPIEALREVALPMPSISLLLSYTGNPFLRRRFRTPLAVIRAAEMFSTWTLDNLFWVAECILRSRLKGPFSLWNFPAVIGMTKRQFSGLISAANPSPLTDEVLLPRAIGVFNYTALDLGAVSPPYYLDIGLTHFAEIAALIRPWFTHLGVLEGPTQVGAALYPVDHLAGPMDVIMAVGFEMMEEDYADASQRLKAFNEGVYDADLGF